MANLDIIKLGVAIDGNRLQIIETSLENDQRVVSNLAEIPLEIPFDFYIIGNKELLGKISDVFNEISEKWNFKATRVGFALSGRMALLKTITVDPDLTETEVKQHLDWEAEQFIVSPRAEYHIAFERIPAADGKKNRIAFVSVRNRIIASLKEIFARTRFKLSSVDIDLFAAIRAINANMDGLAEPYAFVEIGEKGICSCIVRSKQYYGSSDIPFPTKGPGDTQVGEATDSELAGVISEELNRILNREKSGLSLADLRSIYLFGQKFRDEILSELSNRINTRVLPADPFHRVKISATPDIYDATRVRPDRFLISLGMAI